MRAVTGRKRGFLLLIIITILLVLSACSHQGEPESAAEGDGGPQGEPAAQEDSGETDPGQSEEETEAVRPEPELVWSWGHEERIRCLALSPDGQTLAVGSGYVVYTHGLADGTLLDGFTADGRPEDIDLSSDGKTLAMGLQGGGALLLDLENGGKITKLHGGYDNRVIFFPDGKTLATANRDGLIWTWDVETGEALETYQSTDQGWVTRLDLDPSGQWLAATQWVADNPVRIWNLEQGEIVHSIDLRDNPADKVNPFRFSRSGEVMAGAVEADGKNHIVFWKLDDASKLGEIELDRVLDMDFSPDGKSLVVITARETSLWDLATHTRLYTLDQAVDEADILDTMAVVRFTPEGGHIVVGRGNGFLEVWKLPDAKPLPTLSPDSRQPASLSTDLLFDAGSAELKASASSELERLAATIETKFKEGSLTVVGHTDSQGEAADNQKLSLAQAEAVKAWLEDWAEKQEKEDWAILAEGRGCSGPRVPDRDPEGNFTRDAGLLNRRIEILLEADD